VPFQICLMSNMTGEDQAALTGYGIAAFHLAHAPLQADDSWLLGANGEARAAAAVAAAAGKPAKILLFDVEVEYGEYLALPEGAAKDARLDAFADLYAFCKAEDPTVLVGFYGLGSTGAPGPWLDPENPANVAAITALETEWARLHQRYSVVGASLEPDPRELMDISVLNTADRYLEASQASQLLFSKNAAEAYQAIVAPTKPLFIYAGHYSYLESAAGLPLSEAYTQAMCEDAATYADGILWWYGPGFSTSYYGPLVSTPQARPCWSWSVQTINPVEWAAAGTVGLSFRLAQRPPQSISLSFPGVADMDDVAVKIVTEVNAAASGAEGTVGGCWNSIDELLQLWLDYTAGANPSPPGHRGVLTEITLDPAASIFTSLIGGSNDARNGISNVGTDEWSQFALNGGTPRPWLQGLINAAEELTLSTFTIQPGATGNDCYLDAAAPTTVRNTGLLLVDNSTVLSDMRKRPLVAFDVSGVAAWTNRSSVTLSLGFNGNFVDENARPIGLYRVTRAYAESQATWNRYSTGNNWTTAGGDVVATLLSQINQPTVGGTQIFPSTADFLAALAAAIADDGVLRLMVRYITEDGDPLNTGTYNYAEFYSSENATPANRPALTITGNAPPVITPTSPASGAEIVQGQAFTIDATISDDSDTQAALKAAATTSSNVEGNLHTPGLPAAGVVLNTLGAHNLTISSTDSGGAIGTAVIPVTVVEPPAEGSRPHARLGLSLGLGL
jgi:hypothetical protein